MLALAQAFSPVPYFIQPRLSVRGMVVLTFMVDLPFSVQCVETLSQIHLKVRLLGHSKSSDFDNED